MRWNCPWKEKGPSLLILIACGLITRNQIASSIISGQDTDPVITELRQCWWKCFFFVNEISGLWKYMSAETMNNAYSSQACKHCATFNVSVAYVFLEIPCFSSFLFFSVWEWNTFQWLRLFSSVITVNAWFVVSGINIVEVDMVSVSTVFEGHSERPSKSSSNKLFAIKFR